MDWRLVGAVFLVIIIILPLYFGGEIGRGFSVSFIGLLFIFSGTMAILKNKKHKLSLIYLLSPDTFLPTENELKSLKKVPRKGVVLLGLIEILLGAGLIYFSIASIVF